MNRTLLSALLIIATLLTWSPPASAQPGVVTAAAFGTPTTVRAHPTWIRFRPALDGEHLVLGERSKITTLCWAGPVGEPRWDLVYDHTLNYVGWTHSNNIHPGADAPCATFDRQSELTEPVVWARLAPYHGWAHQDMFKSDNVAALCALSFQGGWNVILDHTRNNTVGFVDLRAINERKQSSTPCN